MDSGPNGCSTDTSVKRIVQVLPTIHITAYMHGLYYMMLQAKS